MQAAIYTRISFDPDGNKTGGETQLADCRALCDSREYEVLYEEDDPDISAYGKRVRPGFEAILQAIEADHLDVVVVWHTSRLVRRGRDLQRFLDVAEKHHVELVSVTQPEFSGSMGLLVLRMLSGMDEYESAVKSERVARKMKHRAEAGAPTAGGRRVYGYTADGRHIVPEEARYIRCAVQAILAGGTLTQVVDAWNSHGLRTPGGSAWVAGRLGRLLRAPRIAGIRTYHGEEMAPGTWPAIIDVSTWKAVVAVLDERRRARGPDKVYLLVGILECGKCGGEMRGSGRSYLCKECQGVGISSRTVEQKVAERVQMALKIGPHDDRPKNPKALSELLSLVCPKITVAPAGKHVGRGHDIGKRLTFHWCV